jgi:hypothetical protein
MNTNVNLEAALGVLGFLGACGALLIIFLVAVHALCTRRFARMKKALVAGVCFMMLYLCLMLVFSFVSRERALARGEEKHFCEVDCHLAYSVTDVQRVKTVGSRDNQVTAQGIFYLITVRTRFDEQTIGPRRGDAPLVPNSRVVTVRDASGQSYSPSPAAMRLIEQANSADKPISTPLRPGEYYTTTFVFDLPEAVENPALLINEGELVTHFLIGHENSPLHRKVLFRLDDAPKPQVASAGLGHALARGFKELLVAGLRRIKGYDNH